MPYPSNVDKWVLTGTTTQNHSDSAPTAGTKNGVSVLSTEFDNIPIAGARYISVQIIDDDDASTDLTLEVWTSEDGTNYNTGSYPYAALNLDASADTDTSGTLPVQPGPLFMRIRTTEGNVAAVATTINVTITWE